MTRYAPSVAGRRAFALGSVVFVLFVVLIGVCIWRSWVLSQQIPATHPNKAYLTGMKIGVWLVPVILPLLTLGIAWVIGKIVSLLFGRSDDAGNVGAGLVMAAVVALFGWSTYTAATASPRGNAAIAGQSGTATPGDPSQQRSDRGQEAIDRVAAQMRAQEDAARRAMERARELASPSTLAQPPAQTSPAPSVATPPAALQTKPPAPDLTAQTIEKVQAEMVKDLEQSTDPRAQRVRAFASELRLKPRADVRELRSRAEAIASVRTDLQDLKVMLSGLEADAHSRLVKAGLSDIDARIGSARVNAALGVSSRTFAIDRLVETLDHALTEADTMRANLGQWKYAKDGKVESKNFQVQSSINSARFFLDAGLERWNAHVDEMARGGR